MSNTMGESTKRRLGGVVRSANAGAGAGPGVPAQYVGGWVGGLGGTWGKAATGRGDAPGAAGSPSPAVRPASAGRARPPSPGRGFSDGGMPRSLEAPAAYGTSKDASRAGVRERVRPASAGAKNVWDALPQKELPKSTPHGLTSAKVRPKSATMAKTTKPMAGISTFEYKLQGESLQQVRTSGPPPSMGGGGGGGGGGRGGAAFGEPPPVPIRKPNNLYGNPNRPPTPPRMSQDPGPIGASGSIPPEGIVSEAHLATLEDNIRDTLRMKRSVYEGSKEMLLKLFQAVDDGSGDVSLEEFCGVCERIGIGISIAEAQALFRRFGYDTVMPYQKFAHTLLTQPSRQLATEVAVRKGAFQAGQSAHFQGKILYEKCRKPVYTPSNWDPALADRSAELPNSRLILEFIYGYQAKDVTAQNLFYTSEGKVVYFTAGVGVIYQKPTHSQYFFLGHTDDIKALALCPANVTLQGRDYPAKTIVATGQVTSHEEGPMVCVWDSRLGSQPEGPPAVSELKRIKFSKEDRGIICLAFSPTGKWLVCVASDNQHTVYIYDWKSDRPPVYSNKGQMGDPPQVYGIEWCPFEASHGVPSQFVSFGRKHIKLWTSDGSTGWAVKQMSCGRLPMQNVTSAQWLPPRQEGSSECLIVAGVADGQLYIFKGSAAIKAISAHRPGPSTIQADGHPAYSGVRGMRLIKMGGKLVLLTGGADGTVLLWDVDDGNIADARFAASAVQLQSPFGPNDKNLPQIKSLDYNQDTGCILVGTSHCDVLEVQPSTTAQHSVTTIMDGHSGDVYFIAFHPAKPNIFATTADSGHVHIWDSNLRQMLQCASVGFKPRVVAFSTQPVGQSHHVAVGGEKGNIRVLDEGANLRPVHECKDSKEGISDLKYSPNGRLMAATTFDTFVDIYNVEKGYARIARCSGHSSTVRGLDWSVDSSVIQTDSADLELLYWNARTGKQIPIPQRDTEFATFTCRLGFPVMGVWPPDSDGTDVNAVDRSKCGQFLVTSDDEGMVKLFNYPCVIDDAPHRAYRGHSSHVMCVRYNCNDSLVCSVGGKDWAVFQFKVVMITPEQAPPPPAPKEWATLDGKTYNYYAADHPDIIRPGQQQQRPGSSSMGAAALPPRGPTPVPTIQEEPSLSNSQMDAAMPGPGRRGAPSMGSEDFGQAMPPQQRRSGSGLGPPVERNAAPTRVTFDQSADLGASRDPYGSYDYAPSP